MAEDNIAPQGAQGTAPQGAQDGQDVSDGTDWKAEARKWEQRAKADKARADANDEAARRLSSIEDASKSESQKTADRISKLEADLASAQRETLLRRVQASHGITDEDAALFLTGEDEKTLTAQAKRLAERTPTGPVAPREGTPRTSSSDEPMREFTRALFNSEE
jgi:hypothetical protein